MTSNGEDIFYFDSSALIVIHQYYPESLFAGLWAVLRKFLSEERIRIHQMVYDEIIPSDGKPKDAIGILIKEFKDQVVDVTEYQIESVEEIVNAFPRLIDSGREKNEADPWLISAVRDEMMDTQIFGKESKYILVTQESQRRANKIPEVCRAFEVRNMNLHHSLNH